MLVGDGGRSTIELKVKVGTILELRTFVESIYYRIERNE